MSCSHVAEYIHEVEQLGEGGEWEKEEFRSLLSSSK